MLLFLKRVLMTRLIRILVYTRVSNITSINKVQFRK